MNIGLIAVSGVRIYNERLTRLGVTLPGFVERANVIASMPSLGLLTLAAVTPARHRIEYLECPEYDEERLRDLNFDVVAVSSFTAKADVMYRIADHFRARGVKVVLGGLHCTLMPEEATAHADAVVAGEGELLWPRVLEDIENDTVKCIYRNASFHDVDLKWVPPPRFDLLDIDAYNRLPVQTARGCPLRCEFCAASRIFGGFKTKPVENVVREIREVKKRWPRPFIELADDNTFVRKPWAKNLVRAIAREEVHWFTETDVSVADDPELLDLLAGSGCRQLLIGFESPNAEALRDIDDANWKRKRFDDYRRSIHDIQKRGISVNGCFIVGLDADTPDVFEDIERFVRTSELTEVQVTVLTPFPGTPLYSRLKNEGRLLTERFWDKCTLFDVNFLPKNMSVDDLEKGLEYLMQALYTKREVSRRKRIYIDRIRGRKAS